jgi:hypothetical protein
MMCVGTVARGCNSNTKLLVKRLYSLVNVI